MKKVIIDQDDAMPLSFILRDVPIFAVKNGEVVGMIHEDENKGWILALGGNFGATGHHVSREKCIKSVLRFGYTFVIDLEVH